MLKVTYYFGAGSSIGALPIVNQIPDRMRDMIDLLELEEYQLSDEEKYTDLKIDCSKHDIQLKLIEDLKWLVEKSANHASIDTFAKKLFIKDQIDDLKKLKVVFSIYLILEQIKNKANPRYDSFFASILSNDYYSFPSNIRVLSWNYDFQFEKAFSEYTGDLEVSRNQDVLNIITKYSYDVPQNNRFGIIKLNGTSNILGDRGFRQYSYFQKLEDNITLDLIDKVIRNYGALRLTNWRGLFSGLSFAWEPSFDTQYDIIEHARNESFDTEVLVVIGYSFPYFNREIDRKIIGNMKKLKKAYFQAPDANDLRERFLSIRSDLPMDNLLCRHDVGQFLLPNEL